MGTLIFIILLAILITAMLYRLAYRISPFKNFTQRLSPAYRIPAWFIVLYTPVQLFVLLSAGHHMPLTSTTGHELFSTLFSASHAVLAVMGMVMSMYFYKRNRVAIALLIANAAAAIFYLMAMLIFLQILVK